MKRLLIVSLASFVLVAIFTSCTKDKQELTDTTWVVWFLDAPADSVSVFTFDSPELSFVGKDKYILQSTTDFVTAEVKIEKNNNIKFETPMLEPTSKYVQDCLFLLTNRIKYYRIIGCDQLFLQGDNGEAIVLDAKEFM